MAKKDIVASASVAGQNHGAIARAAVINAALYTRDTLANKVKPAAKTSGTKAYAAARRGAETGGTGLKAVAAYVTSFVRNVVER